MKREDAFYYKNLLMLGISDGYDEWLNYYLETEDPLSNIVLELSCCGADINKTISLLHNYCNEQPFDESAACDKVRLFFKEAYYSKKMSKEYIANTMYRLALNIENSVDFNMCLWGSMFYFEDYLLLAKDGIISWESFDTVFFAYLNDGTPLDSNLIWSKNIETKPSLLDKVKSLFKRK